jgi:hypothetical protein
LDERVIIKRTAIKLLTMKLRYLPFLFIVLMMNACMWGTPNKQKSDITTDTLAYTYKTIKQRASDCGSKSDSGCTIADIKYPEFKKDTVLNDSVKNRLFNLFWTDTTPEADTDLQKYASGFINIYEQNKNSPDVKGRVFTLKSSAKVIRQDSSLTTLEIGGYMFQGGAHGHTLTYLFNWNTKANKVIGLSDIFVKDYEGKLNEIADTIFRNQELLGMDASLAQNYFFKNNQFALNNNFLITPVGIRFLYNQYEIKPYAAGQTNLLIPYTKIKSLLLPHTVVSQYIK